MYCSNMTRSNPFYIENFLPYILSQAAEAVSAEFQSYYKEKYGILRTEWRVLFHLGSFGQMTAKDIGIRAKTHKTKISRAVFRLDKNNLITRTSSEKDRRIELLSLTKKGIGVYNDLKTEAELFEEKVSENFSDNEIAVLKRCLEKIGKQFI